MIKDVQANKGAMISYKGFTSSAQRVAEANGIDLYRLIDAENLEWPVYLSWPMLIESRNLGQYKFTLSNIDEPFIIPPVDPEQMMVYTENGQEIGTVKDIILYIWDSNDQANQVGIHNIIIERVRINQNGLMNIMIEFSVTRLLYTGYIGIDKLQGFLNEHTGSIHTDSLVTKNLDFYEVEQTWRKIQSRSELPVKPAIKMIVLGTYDESGSHNLSWENLTYKHKFITTGPQKDNILTP